MHTIVSQRPACEYCQNRQEKHQHQRNADTDDDEEPEYKAPLQVRGHCYARDHANPYQNIPAQETIEAQHPRPSPENHTHDQRLPGRSAIADIVL